MTGDNVVQEKSYQLALSIIKLVNSLAKSQVNHIIGNQLLRSGTSVGANVEEALAGYSKEDFSFKMSIALKEARETHYWLRLIRDANLRANSELDPIMGLTEEVMKILGAIVRSSRKK